MLLLFPFYSVATNNVGGSNSGGSFSNINYFGWNDYGVSVFPEFKDLKMHIRCYRNLNLTKINKPTAIFDSGLPFPSLAYADFIEELIAELPSMNIGKVCFFDRYGYGYSDPSPYALNSNETAYRLHESLRIAHINPPYILAGWSWGNVDNQFFAHNYMQDVVGILSIDGTDSGYATDSNNLGIISTATTYFNNLVAMQNNGTIKSFTEHNVVPMAYGYLPNNTNMTQSVVNKINNLFITEDFLNVALQELSIMISSTQLLANVYSAMNVTCPLSNIPFFVLTADQNDTVWNNRQTQMATMSSVSEHIFIKSSHFIPIDKPYFIVSSLKSLLKNVDKQIPINVLQSKNNSLKKYEGDETLVFLNSLAAKN
ncbi:hypothetical protein PPL_08028 [Heterostelium album PN500]|uniref:AB hydrolase-1 domain-containing protein n=1 Tax=Heterostelium pallidum (strain ATCC 26659 / Pp 5 / PN500) TaxID=670386 RepID=D3BHM4_HETP5|nr:hypothetical protein PPL_08028 [Heterostelium album PN500]EFA79201.1 hypothetical protein PPL_08028 [Heterostelium album PN500]|eukprot:XP_020431322.1 hypothetical protein PPL_08028 [Heterostelium album PN500]